MPKKVTIGIDLGTTNSCVGLFRDGKVEIIANSAGSRITPSCVAFDENGVHVGQPAKDQALINLKNTVFEAKRLIGRQFTDATVQEDRKQWPFVVLDHNGALNIRVQYKGNYKFLPPEEISACVLASLKKTAEDFIGEEVHDAVITVPAYFNNSQRQATIDAGKIAGLNVLRIINEPTAAALAYGHLRKVIRNKTALVFDLGGGTFDVAILTIDDKTLKVKAVGGDSHLGGSDFDSKLTEHYVQFLKTKYNLDISENAIKRHKLRKACKEAKISLSSKAQTAINVDGLIRGDDFVEKLYRPTFEKLCMDLFEDTIKHVKSTLREAGMDKSEIDEVILVGGSTRIPKIQELLSEFFDGKELNKTVNPDEAVAYGAAVKAALISGEHTIEEIMLTDVVPLSLGTTNEGGDIVKFIMKNSCIPTKVVQKNWTTTSDYQMAINVDVHEGERERAVDNHFLGSFLCPTGERELKGVPKFTITFMVDGNGILVVYSVNEKTNTKGSIVITNNKGRLTTNEILWMTQDVKEMGIS